MNPDVLLLRKRIIEAALDAYLNVPERFTVEDVIEAAGVTKAEFYAQFDSLLFVPPAFYSLCLAQYRAVRATLDGYDAFTLEERLATFIFLMFDFLEEQEAFVKQTFRPYLLEHRAALRFRDDLQQTVATLLDADDIPSVNRFVTEAAWLHAALARAYLELVHFWLEDDSPQRQKTVALTDKVVAFFVELATFRGIERGVDLAKYLVNIREGKGDWEKENRSLI